MNENEAKIISMLTDVLERQTHISTNVEAIHNSLIELRGDAMQQGWDISKMKEVLFGADGQGGGLVDRVKALEFYGASLPPWVFWVACIALGLLTIASVCVIGLTYIAARVAVGM